MKVLYVANDASLYGSNLALLNLVNAIKKYDIDIEVLIPRGGEFEQVLQKNNIKYKKIMYCTDIERIADKKSMKSKIKLFINFLAILPICIWIKIKKFDLIHSNNLAVGVGAEVANKLKIKHIWHVRELLEEDHGLQFMNKGKEYKLMEKSDALIFISKAVMKKYDFINNNNKVLIYDGVETVKEKYIEKNFEEKEKFNILLAGKINGNKGHEEAIKAMELLKKNQKNNVKLYIAGDGPKEEEYRRYVKEHNLESHIEFLGFVNDMDKLRKKMDIALICSKNEAFGRVTVEAMMKENFVIAANTGGTKEIIQNNVNGILYKQGNYNELAEKIQLVIENKFDSRNIIKKAYEKAYEDYNIEKCALSVYEVYKSLMEDK